MTLRYTLSPGDLREGAAEHYNYRHKKMLIFAPLFGLGALAYGIYMILIGGQTVPIVLGVVLCLLSLTLFFRKRLYTALCARSTFRGRPDQINVAVEADESEIKFVESSTTTCSNWGALVDYRVCEMGLLLYPQPRIFIWVPARADCEGGAWDDFCELVEGQVQRKI